MRAARAAIDRTEPRALLVGRTEGFLVGSDDLGEVIARLQAYSGAGADVLYAPGLRSLDQVAQVVAAVAPKPVNVLLGFIDASVSELAAAGARRLSTGAALAAASFSAMERAADTLIETGRLPTRS
jgi:2-methylisocitrate lyase-like PEP mutase family enzyme